MRKFPVKGEKCRKKTAKGEIRENVTKGEKGVIATRWKVKACHQIKLLQNFADVQAFKFSFQDTAAVGELTSIDYSAAVLPKLGDLPVNKYFNAETTVTAICQKSYSPWFIIDFSDTHCVQPPTRILREKENATSGCGGSDSWDGNEFINLRENPHPFRVIIRSHEIIKRISNTLPGHR